MRSSGWLSLSQLGQCARTARGTGRGRGTPCLVALAVARSIPRTAVVAAAIVGEARLIVPHRVEPRHVGCGGQSGEGGEVGEVGEVGGGGGGGGGAVELAARTRPSEATTACRRYMRYSPSPVKANPTACHAGWPLPGPVRSRESRRRPPPTVMPLQTCGPVGDDWRHAGRRGK